MSGNRFYLIAAQAFGQLSIVLATPFLTRLFEPAELGRYQLAFSVGVLLQPFLTLRYESIIPSEKVEAAIPRYLRLVAVASVLVIIILALLAVVGVILSSETFASVVVMTGIITISYSMTAIDNAVLIRQKEMDRLAVRNVLTGVLVASLQIVFAMVFRSVIWIAAAILVGRLSAILLTRKLGQEREAPITDENVVRIEWGRTAYRIAAHLVGSLSLNAMVLYSQFSFGPSATAYVGMAQRSASAPLGLISQALSQIVQATIGEAVRLGELSLLRHVHSQMRSMLPFSVATMLGLIILGPRLAVPVFGDGWETTGQVIAVLGVPAGLQLLVSPISPVFFMLGADQRLFQVQLFRLVISVVFAFGFQILFDDLILAIIGYSVGTCFGYIYTYLALRDEVGKFNSGSLDE